MKLGTESKFTRQSFSKPSHFFTRTIFIRTVQKIPESANRRSEDLFVARGVLSGVCDVKIFVFSFSGATRLPSPSPPLALPNPPRWWPNAPFAGGIFVSVIDRYVTSWCLWSVFGGFGGGGGGGGVLIIYDLHMGLLVGPLWGRGLVVGGWGRGLGVAEERPAQKCSVQWPTSPVHTSIRLLLLSSSQAIRRSLLQTGASPRVFLLRAFSARRALR